MATKLRLIISLMVVAWFSPPVASQSLTDIGTPVESLFYHIRLSAPKHKNLKFKVYWNCTDSDSTYLELSIEPPGHDDFYASACRYSIIHNGSPLASGKEEFSYTGKGEDGFSAIISADRSGAELSFGTAAATFSLPIDFDMSNPGSIGFENPGNHKEITNLLITRNRSERKTSPYLTVDSLKEHLNKSEDIYEGLWTYLDRDIDRSRADIGAFYSLATVANGDGTYDIVYLGGEQNYSSDWEPMQLKGKLIPTPFIDNFDLIWETADGRTLRHDTNATFEAGRAALRLNFPLFNSSMRLRRHPTP